MNAGERQARRASRARNAGMVRLGIWIPRKTHIKLKREALERGITMQDRAIQKLDA